jgi:hypothetical protein
VIEGIHAEGPIVADLGGTFSFRSGTSQPSKALPVSDSEMPQEEFEALLDYLGSILRVTRRIQQLSTLPILLPGDDDITFQRFQKRLFKNESIVGSRGDSFIWT